MGIIMRLGKVYFSLLLLLCVVYLAEATQKDFEKYLSTIPLERGQKTRLLEDFKHSHKISSTNVSDMEAYTRRRKDFDEHGVKRTLIKEWETQTKKAWPHMDLRATPIAPNRGLAGHLYEVHHIIPLEYNGKNQWWNIVPLTVLQHQQAHKRWESFFK